MVWRRNNFHNGVYDGISSYGSVNPQLQRRVVVMRDWDWAMLILLVILAIVVIGMMIEDKKPEPEPQPQPAQFVMEVIP